MSSKAESKDINGAAAGHQPVAAKERYAFGGHLLEATPRLLSRQGERLAITPKSFDVLLLLVRNPGRVIGKEEFFQTLWPDSVVEEANLTQTIFVLRKILREKESGHSFISTIPGRGYSFVCPVSRIEEPPAHAVDSPPVHGGSRPSRALWVGIGIGTEYLPRGTLLALVLSTRIFRDFPAAISDCLRRHGVVARVLARREPSGVCLGRCRAARIPASILCELEAISPFASPMDRAPKPLLPGLLMGRLSLSCARVRGPHRSTPSPLPEDRNN